jgi:molybdopterin-containing oxidoreductase family iron-sulfur binding subunit
MGVDAAKSRGLKTGDMVTVRVNGTEVVAPVMLLPGHNTGSITLPLGYGRTMKGRICTDAGFDFYPLRSSAAMGFASATIAKTGETYTLATTQDHYPMDSTAQSAVGGVQQRLPTLFREGNLDEYRKDPHFASHRTHVVHRLSLFEEDHPFQRENGFPGANYAWALSIDLNACTGCNACVIACQAENNVPIVGKDQVKRNREMHWLRVDRYFKGGSESQPEGFVLAPVVCMHCENAPCEQVCPVAATVHDEDGLNVMVYNRCVGTRYCSNNCPYKVRRFNYFDYWRREPQREQPGTLLQVPEDYYIKGQAKADPLHQMQFNPDVTVRMRGIMEKCTYCVQRITRARIDAKNQWVRENPDDRSERVAPIADGTITPACSQACPAQAIVFGDLKDPKSRVSKLHKDHRAYEMLEELNTKPRTKYMAKLRNPAFVTASATPGHGHGAEHS